MKQVIIALALLLGGQGLYAEEKQDTVTISKAEAAKLKTDLLKAQKETLEVRAKLHLAEELIIRMDIGAFQQRQSELKKELSDLFKCDYDIEQVQCIQKEKE